MMTAWQITFAPLVPEIWLWLALALVVLLTVYSLVRRLPGGLLRGGALAMILAVLANPALLNEERDPLKDVAAIIVDRSASQSIDGRAEVTRKTTEALETTLKGFADLDTRIVTVDSASQNNADGTHLFAALRQALADVTADRIAGAFLITDGQIHDVPQNLKELRLSAPVHALVTGRKNERDRKLTIEKAPRYGIVGEQISIGVRVDEYGAPSRAPTTVTLNVRVDGTPLTPRRLITGLAQQIRVDITHGGQNVIELEVESAEGELTLLNNRVVVLANGIRDRLRVLLVSGEPHAGERTWRDLLKADPSVDLVHFTILRPPEKQDGTPIGELSLIPFPTRELFSLKLNEFDLIIFDRYRLRGVLPVVYLGNIARFVENGGALLTAAGPAFATPYSLFRSPLSAVLPSQPTGDVYIQGFKPKLTRAGTRHPVTAGLPGVPPAEAEGPEQDPSWGRWFRLIDSQQVSGQVLMSGARDRPLLILDHVKEGRVAQMMSDQAWLWKRGFEGGGPQAELLRRLAHWLMKEPDLEEEDLRARVQGGRLEITRRSMAETVGTVTVTFPSGTRRRVSLDPAGPGLWTATLPVEELGLYHLNDMTLSTVATVGPLNPKEFKDVRATAEHLTPVIRHTGGGLFWVREGLGPAVSGAPDLPAVRRTRPGRDQAGPHWAGLMRNGRYTVRAVTQHALLGAPLALSLILGALLLGWYREGR